MRLINADALIERWNNMSVRGRTEFDQEIMVAPSINFDDYVPREFHDRTCEEMARRHQAEIAELTADRPQGEWITKTVKKFCAPDCWCAGIFAIEGTWNEEEGSWLEEQDGFCSECGKQDEHYYGHNFCPNCGARMKGAYDADE